MVPIHLTNKEKLCFFVGDASQVGSGGATQFPEGIVMSLEGFWDPNFVEWGSNLQEAQNQFNQLLQEIRVRKHDGCKLWAVADILVWSAIWNKGSSSAHHLFYLVLTLKQEARKHERYF
jgi:hypothetical protein